MEQENKGLLPTQNNDSVRVVVSKAPIISPIFDEVGAGLSYREIMSRYDGLADNHTKIYHDGEIVNDWDLTCDDGLVSIVQVPSALDPITIAYIAIASAVVGAVVGYLMYEDMEQEVPKNEKQRRVQGDKNGNKGYEPLPFILGKRKVTPAYAAYPYTEHVGTDQYYNMLLHIGYGPLKVSDIKIGNSPITSFDQTDTEWAILDWYENTDPNKIKDVWRYNVSQTSIDSEVPRQQNFLNSEIPIGEGRTEVVIEYPQGLKRQKSSAKHLANSVQISYREQGVDGRWLTPAPYFHRTSANKGVVPYRLFKEGGVLYRAPANNWTDGGDNFGEYTYSGDPFENNFERTLVNGPEPVPTEYIVYDDGEGYVILNCPDDYYVATMSAWAKTSKGFTKSYSFDQTIYGDISTTDPVPFRIRNNSTDCPNCKYPWFNMVRALTVTRSAKASQNSLNEILAIPNSQDPVAKQNVRHALIALRVRASDQLSGTLDDLNVMAESVTPSNLNDDWRNWWTDVGVRSTLTTTKNPAMLYKWVLQGPMNPVRVGNERIDIASISDWKQTCDTEGWETSSIVNYEGTLKSTLNNVAKTGRAEYTMRNAQFGVIENTESTVPVNIFTSKNSRDFSSKRDFPDISDGITIEFQNEEEDFEVDEYTYYDPEVYDGQINSTTTIDNRTGKTDSLELWGVSNPQLIQKHGRFAYLEKKLRRETYTLKTDIEALSCERGSLVKIANDVIDVGLGQGFIESVGSGTFTIDETIGLDTGTVYTLSIRTVDLGTKVEVITATYQGGGNWTTSDPINFEEGDLAAYGVGGKETLDCIVTNISYDNDYEATLTLVNAANEIYSLDKDALPVYETNLTPRPESFPPAVPVVEGSIGSSGYNDPTFKVTVSKGNSVDNVSYYKLQYRTQDEFILNDDGELATILDENGNTISVEPVDDPSSYVWIDAGTASSDYPVFEVPIPLETGTKFYFRAKAFGTGNLTSAWSDEIEIVVSEEPADDVQSITLTEIKDKPKTPNTDFSTIEVEIVPPVDVNYLYSILEYRVPKVGQNPQDGWFGAGLIGWNDDNKAEIVVSATGATYEVRVRSVSIYNEVNETGLFDQITVTNISDPDQGNYDPIPVPEVTGLELFGQGLDTEFAGKDAKFTWRKSSYADWVELGAEAGAGANGSKLDLYFRDYQVEIYANNTLIRTENTTDNFYTYSYEMNAEDYKRNNASVGAYREFQIRVIQRGRNNEVSANAAVLDVYNNPPAMPTNLKISGGFNVIEISYDKPDDLDYAGMQIWVETTSGFDETVVEPIATISDNSFVITGLEQSTPYYLKFRPFDDFGKFDALVSAEYSVTTKSPSSVTSGLGDWAYEIEPVSRTFIENHIEGGAIDLGGSLVGGQLAGVQLADASVTTEKLTNLSVEASKLAGSAVTSTKIANLAVGSAAIANLAVTNGKIGNLAVDNAKIDDLAVDTAKIADLAVTDAKIVDLTAAKITTGTLNATQTITAEGLIRAVDNATTPRYQVGIGPLSIDNTTYLMWAYDQDATIGSKLRFGIDELGNAYFRGNIEASAFNNNELTIDEQGNLDSTGVFRFGGATSNYVEFNGNNLIIDTPNFSVDASGNASYTGTITLSNVSDSGDLAGKDLADWQSDITGTGKPANYADVTDYRDNRVANAIESGGATTIRSPVGGQFSQDTSVVTGAIKIKLPQSYTNTMLQFVVDVFDYVEGRSFSLRVAGYNSAASGWTRTSVNMMGGVDADNTVRFAHDGSNCCVVIGDTNFDWRYPKVYVRDFQAGYSSSTISQWETNWGVTFITTLPTTIDKTYSDALLDARAIKNQKALATQDSADWQTQVSGSGKPANNADRTQTAIQAGTTIGQGYLHMNAGSANLAIGSSRTFGTDGIQFQYNNGNPRAHIGDVSSGQYLQFDNGILQLGPKTNIGNNDDVAVTVGSGGDYPTINAALEALSRTVPAYKSGGFTATITILTNTVISENIEIVGLNLGWITIKHQNGYNSTVKVDGSSIQDFFIRVRQAGVSPVIDFPIEVINTNLTTVTELFSVRSGSRMRYNPDEVLFPNGANIISLGKGIGVACTHGSTFEGGSLRFDGFSLGIDVSYGSSVSLGWSELKDCTVGLNVNNGSNLQAGSLRVIDVKDKIGDIENSSSANLNNMYAIAISTGSRVSGLVCSSGSRLSVSDASFDDFNYTPLRADFGGYINAYQANVQDDHGNFLSGVEGLTVSRGSWASAILLEGTINQTANTVTSNGIIFR